MDTEKTTEGDVDTTNNEGEGNESSNDSSDVVTLKKEEYDKLNQTLGSLKKEVKDLKKPKEEPKETPEEKPKADNALLEKLEKLAIKQAGLEHEDDVELAKTTAKKWNMDIDEVLSDPDFKVKLERQQEERSNVEATSNVRGDGSGQTQAKNTTEYWSAKGVPPTPKDVPDAKVRRKIVRDLLNASKGNGESKFYNS